jgi:hypothetical protein
MVEKYDLFVGSQATDFGEIFKTKEELWECAVWIIGL